MMKDEIKRGTVDSRKDQLGQKGLLEKLGYSIV
jgi:hypothetical protein